MKNVKSLINNPWYLLRLLGGKGLLRWIPDKPYLQLMYRANIGKSLDLNNPKTFNEKMQWLKLYDRNPLYTTLVDKYMVRQFISQKIGDEFLIPLIGVWDDFSMIDIEKLPNQFVLKCNHDSGTVVICRDKGHFDFDTTKAYLNSKVKRNFFYGGREWPYKNVKPKIICEKYLEDINGNGLADYKIYCFNGIPKLIMIATDRFSDRQTHFDYFDNKFNWLDLEWGVPRSAVPPQKPEKFELMMQIAAKLSSGIPQVRVDFYEVNGSIYFGEMTLYDGSGFQKITPEKWDYLLGKWIKLPYEEK